jgi:hypothetical protein
MKRRDFITRRDGGVAGRGERAPCHFALGEIAAKLPPARGIAI